MKNVTLKQFDEEVNTGRHLVNFYADWCGPCILMKLILESVDLGINILRVNIDEEPGLTRKFSVMSIPTVLIIDNGIVTARRSGLMTLPELQSLINE